ncbi:hypothetical protein FACS189499_03710 [Clostridia bacterium]|nr:hypothetical protein FACS189499_03710 [Clostridia bacterium]
MNFLKNKHIVVTIILTLLMIMTLPSTVEHMMLVRGYFAIGGEWLLPALPWVIYALGSHMNGTLDESEEDDDGDT